MVFGIRLTPEQEEQLSHVANAQGCSRSACVRQALDDYLVLHGGNTQLAAQQSLAVAKAAQPADEAWSEPLPDWADWTA